MELELIFYETLMYFGHTHSPVWSGDLYIARKKDLKLIWNTFSLKPWFSPSGPSEQMMKESASHHISWEKPLATPRGQSLWILCASTGDLWILGWFCGFIWLRGGVFGTSPSLQIGTFLMELWWSGKLSEPPWSHIVSSWIISEIFKIFHKFVILDLIFTTFCQPAGSCWSAWG